MNDKAFTEVMDEIERLTILFGSEALARDAGINFVAPETIWATYDTIGEKLANAIGPRPEEDDQ